MINGRCQCAVIQYQGSGARTDYCHCHCSICRRLHGAAFASWGGVLRDEFSYVSGEEKLRSYPFSENSDSLYCESCGSRVLVDFKAEPHMLYLAMGTIDEDVDLPDGYHQFVGSKAPWFEITDSLPQYDEWPDDS